MGSSLAQLIARVEQDARIDPRQAPAVYARGARQILGLAKDPRNARAAAVLRETAAAFAERAREAEETLSTDFEQLEEDTDEAYQAEGGDNLALIARRRSIQQEQLDEAQVRLIPKSVGEETVLGRVTVVKFNPTEEDLRNQIKQSDDVVFWQGKKVEAQAATVDIGVRGYPTNINAIGGPISLRPYIVVEYGSDGFTTSVEVDVGLGVRLTVVGNYVSVKAAMDPPDPGKVSGPLAVGGSLGFFAAASTAPVYRSRVMQLPVGSPVLWMSRPAKAQVLMPPFFSWQGGKIRVRAHDSAGSIIGVRTYDGLLPPEALIPWYLPGETFAFSVESTGDPTNVRFPFQLAL